MRAYACLLGVLSAVFATRVLGQLWVALCDVRFLPPMDAWYSGLIPYPLLLAAQVAILGIQFEITRQLWRGTGAMTTARPGVGLALAWFSVIYFLLMVARYVMTNVVMTGAGQFGDTIPIVFHWVLAAYLWVLARHLRGVPFYGRGQSVMETV